MLQTLHQYTEQLQKLGKLEIVDYSSDAELDEVQDADTLIDEEEVTQNFMSLGDFLADFGDSLFDAVSSQNKAVYQGEINASDDAVLENLTRKLFPAQKTTVNAVSSLLFDENQPAGIINAEMGTGKTMMAIATAAIAHHRGYQRTLVLSPPHLVYKWRREILQTIPNAKVTVLNGADTLSKLVLMKKNAFRQAESPEFYILGRVRMRMDYHWKPAYSVVQKADAYLDDQGHKHYYRKKTFQCPECGKEIKLNKQAFGLEDELIAYLGSDRRYCECGSPLWSLCRKSGKEQKTLADNLLDTIASLPTLGKKTATRLIEQFGVDTLATILEDSPLGLTNLMDENGELVFSDSQAKQMERALGKTEFSCGKGGYQPTEFIKRYLPKNYFGLLVVDEGHEYKNYGTAQGQAMGTLSRCCQKILCLTGTLMGGYADDLFYLLWRLNPQAMIEDGFIYNKSRSLGTASSAFMQQHGVLKEISKYSNSREYDNGSFTSSRAKRVSQRIARAPGFSPLGLMRYVLPMTVFLKLKDIGGDVLPSYTEHFRRIDMDAHVKEEYDHMENELRSTLKAALAKGDNTLTGTVTNALLSYPDCCHTPQEVFWKFRNTMLWRTQSAYDETTPNPKEADMLEVVKENLAKGRKCLVYTVYSDTKDTTGRLKTLLANEGIKASVLKASVKADEREDWVLSQLDKGCEVLICNPELVKTGLDLLQFPTIYFMQTGYNVYTVMQAARRSWRIGQTEPVEVYFAGFANSVQQICLELMGKKISVSQSTSGDMPENGLDILNTEEASIEVELAKRLIDR